MGVHALFSPLFSIIKTQWDWSQHYWDTIKCTVVRSSKTFVFSVLVLAAPNWKGGLRNPWQSLRRWGDMTSSVCSLHLLWLNFRPKPPKWFVPYLSHWIEWHGLAFYASLWKFYFLQCIAAVFSKNVSLKPRLRGRQVARKERIACSNFSRLVLEQWLVPNNRLGPISLHLLSSFCG